MTITRRKFVLASTVAGALGGFSLSVRSASAPVRVICPYAPGGGTDTITRLMANGLAETRGQPYIVENRPGAAGTIGHQFVASSRPDGGTLLLGAIGPLAVAPHLMKVSYDPLKDLAPITMGAVFPNVLVVSPALGIKTVKEFIELANTGKLSYGSTGIGSSSHLAGELLNSNAGVNILHVPYKGGSAALVDVIGGALSAFYATPSSSKPFIDSGKLVALATTGLTRSEILPDVPTIAESGFKEFSALNWYCFMAQGKTPAPILDKLNDDMVSILKRAKVREELLNHGLTPQPSSRAELRQFIESESTRWGKLIHERNIASA